LANPEGAKDWQHNPQCHIKSDGILIESSYEIGSWYWVDMASEWLLQLLPKGNCNLNWAKTTHPY
jgi:hypothetical protein